MVLRRVPSGHWLAAERAGVVRRVHDSGAAWRSPLERWVAGPAGPVAKPLLVRAGTADGARVLLVTQAVVEFARPRPGTAYVDPWPAAERAAEAALARVVEKLVVADVTGDPTSLVQQLRHVASATVDCFGVTLLDLELIEVGLPQEQDEEKSSARGAC